MEENEIHFIDRLFKHIRRVQDNMILLEKNRERLPFKIMKWDLVRTGFKHDFSKLEPHLISDYIDTNTYFRCRRLKIPCDIKVNRLQNAWDLHERKEDHHPEYKTEMFAIALCEMCCDISAMAQEFNEVDYTKFFREKLIKDVPMLEKYRDECIKILKLLQELNAEG